MTQMEISIKYIEIINSKNLNFEEFDTRLLCSEVESGMHYLKKREKYGNYSMQLNEGIDIIF